MQLGSDVIRDGMFLELVSPSGQVVAEVFRFDATQAVKLEIFETSTPLAEIRGLVQAAVDRLGPFENGMPLSSASNYQELVDILRDDA
jgi:hypothetical protein